MIQYKREKWFSVPRYAVEFPSVILPIEVPKALEFPRVMSPRWDLHIEHCFGSRQTTKNSSLRASHLVGFRGKAQRINNVSVHVYGVNGGPPADLLINQGV